MAETTTGSRKTNRKSGFAYAAGITLVRVGSGVLPASAGLLDRWFGTHPWFLIGGIVLGSAAGFYQFVRISSKTL